MSDVATQLTAQQLIRWSIIQNAVASKAAVLTEELTPENVDEIFEESEHDTLSEACYEFREGTVETNIPHEWSRHYEAKSVASPMHNGQWVGWTYWYGGGKHGNPEAIDWMSDAYLLDCKEEEKTVTVRTFTRQVAA